MSIAAKCPSDQHMCTSSKKCIPKASRCDGIADCEAKEDELDCGKLLCDHELLVK